MNNRNNPKLAILLLAALLAMPGVSAQEFDTIDAAPVRFPIAIDNATATQVIATFPFNITEPGDVKVAFVSAPPNGYATDFAFQNGTDPFVVVASNVIGTAASTAAHIVEVGALRATIDLPTVAARVPGIVELRLSLTLNTTLGGGGSGGDQVPTILRVVQIYFGNTTTDSDLDGLPDAWEEDNFGHLDQDANDDPDEDGYTNEEELNADTDPNNSASHPAVDVVGGGGGHLDDRETGNLAFGFLVTCLVVALGLLFAVRKKSERSWLTVGLPIGLGVVVGFGLPLLFDRLHLGGKNVQWDWWAWIHVPWQILVVFSVVSGVVLLGAGVAFYHLQQRHEKYAALIALGVIAATAGVLYLLYWPLGFQLPF